MPPTPAKLWAARDIAREALRIGATRGARGPVTDVVTTDVRLDRLPVLTCWPEDGGPFITLPLVYTEHPERPGHNLGMYRLQIHDPRTTGMHWQIGKGGGFHYAAAEAKNEALPVTVFLGGPPALILSAIAPLPENVPELMLASLIAGEKLKLTDGPRGTHRFPHALVANAEFALIGRVPPRERRPEGPFGDHYGYYSLKHDYPIFNVERLAHRRDAIYPATVVGKPRQEDFFIGDLLQELLSPLFPLVMPAVRALWSYGETGYHSLAAGIVRERYGREAMASAFRILGEGQLSLQKFLILTDRHVDLKDFRATLVHLLERTHPETDLYVFSNLSMDTLDYTGPRVNEGSKGVWLGLGDPVRTLPREFRATDMPSGVRDVRVFCPGLSGDRRAVVHRRSRSRRASRRASRVRRLAARRVDGRCRARGAKSDEFPVDDVHAVRAGGGHPRGEDARGAESSVVHAADPDRRADEAVVPGGVDLPAGRRRNGDAPLARIFPEWAGDGGFGARPPGVNTGGRCGVTGYLNDRSNSSAMARLPLSSR